jgi:pyrroline-5-carboxylate reductase
VVAEQLHGEARAGAWQQTTAAAPRFAQYQRKTDRELPVIRLMPRPAAASRREVRPARRVEPMSSRDLNRLIR